MNKLVINYGINPKEMTKEALEALLDPRQVGGKTKIGIKPNLIKDVPSESGATTSPEIVAGIIEYLLDYSCQNIVVLESSAIGYDTDRAFFVCGYKDLASRYSVKLLNLKDDKITEVSAADMKLRICKSVLDLDYLINVPVLKAHCQTKLTCALKNLKGCIPDSEKRRFHSQGLHHPIAALNAAIKTDLVVVDGMCGDLTFEEGGNPVPMNRIIVGYDPVLIDAYGAELIGLNPHSIQYITLAQKYGIGSMDLEKAEIIELGHRQAGQPILASPLANQLSGYIDARSACSVCYGSLIHALARLQEEGFLKVLSKKNLKIKIGQGFRNKKVEGIGIGNCTAGIKHNLPGCPPKAKDIVEYIRNELCKININ